MCMTCLLTIALDTSRRSAAATKLPSSTTVRNTLRLVSVSIDIVYADGPKAEKFEDALALTDRIGESKTHQMSAVAAFEQQIAEHPRAVRLERAYALHQQTHQTRQFARVLCGDLGDRLARPDHERLNRP